MKSILAAVCVVALVAGAANAATVAYWNFDDQTNLGGPSGDLWRINPLGTAAAPTEYQRDQGRISAEISAWGTADPSEGNLVGTNGGTASNNFGTFTGTTLNDIRVPQSSGGALSIVGSGNNGHYILIELNGGAVYNGVMTYATRGTATGYDTHNWEYSTNGGTTWNALSLHAANKTATWAVHTVTLGNIFASYSGPELNILRLTVTGATSVSGNNRLDNIVITPEPATLALLAFGGLLLRRRRA